MSLSPEAVAKLLAQPALSPPSGVTPDFDNPPNTNGLAWFVTTFCMVIATLCIFLRLYSRCWLDKTLRLEEVLMIGAYGAYWGTAYAGYALIYAPGYGIHTWNLHNKDLIRPLYLILVYGCCYSATLPLIKTAILLDWGRIFIPIDRRKNLFWWGCMTVIALQCLWGMPCIILLNAQCRPHEAIWKFYLPSKCYSLPSVMLTSASVQVVSDIAMFLLPQRIIWRLQMNWQKKIGISIIFGVGILASVAACLRLARTVDFARMADTMYLISPLLFWACAEMTCGFFIFSVPCLSKIIIASGMPRKVKRALGFSGQSNGPSNENPDHTPDYGSHPARKPSNHKPWMAPDSTYSRLEEGGIQLKTPGKSESQTTLHVGPQSHEQQPPLHVTCTSDISIVSESRSHAGNERDGTDHWTR
ncbi:putative 60s ribosomal protein l36 protein [Penicillium brasilianum]|uniref:Putative 60s ribosomal protein l36 protein n=1 Tax=Penicillium brasilianum TaxID=104259 RepID=A0A1S9RTT3_PENBI|nr:putative 60s ribosomal protein l36 protein [Penicillium brasilianum]